MAVHAHWYISLLFSAKQQREITKFCVVWRPVNHSNLRSSVPFLFRGVFLPAAKKKGRQITG